MLTPRDHLIAAIELIEAMRGEQRIAHEEALDLASKARDAMPVESEMDKETDQ